MIIGAGVGFKKYLRVRGVGYKFERQNSVLTAKVGYTHLLKKRLPSEFSTKLSRKSKVVKFRSRSLTGITALLSQFRTMRQPDVYKGKGIRYKRDPVRRKPGKRKTKAVSKKKKIFNRRKVPLRKRRKKKRKRKTRLKLFLSKNLFK
jgi:large subunit ribosomal protein L6